MRQASTFIVAFIAASCYLNVSARGQTFDASSVTIATEQADPSLAPTLQSLDQVDTNDITAAVGKGYDPIEDRILPTVCVVAKNPSIVLEPRTSATVFFDVTKSVRSNQSASQTSIGLGALLKTVSLGFEHSDIESNYFNSVDGFGRIRAQIAVKGLTLDAVQWSSKDGVQNSLIKPMAFAKKCGTKFVRAVYSGHLFDEWVKSTLRQDKKTAGDANALSIGFGKVFSLSAGTADASAHVNCYADTSMQFHGLGALALPQIGARAPAGVTERLATADKDPAGPPKPPTTPEPPPLPSGPEDCAVISSTSALQGLIDYYNKGFRAAVAQAKLDTAVPLYVILDSYTDPDVQLPSIKALPSWINQLVLLVSNYTDNYYDLVGAISDLNYALEEGPVSRIETFYIISPEVNTGVSPPVPLSAHDVAVRKLATATSMLHDFKDALIACRTYAGGPETIDGKSAVSRCQDKLEASMSLERVAGVKIKRKYQ